MVVELVLDALVEVSTTVGPPPAADEMDAKPPNTATAESTPTTVAEKILIYLDVMVLLAY